MNITNNINHTLSLTLNDINDDKATRGILIDTPAT